MRYVVACFLGLTLSAACKGQERPPSTADTSGAPVPAVPPSSATEPANAEASGAPSAAPPTQAMGSASADAGAGGAPLKLEDSGKHLTLAVGTTFSVELRGNAGTGFEWEVNHVDPRVVVQNGPPTRTPMNPGQPGGRSLQTFSFTAKAPGSAHVEIDFKRHFESRQPAKKFVVDVTVK